MDFDRWRQLHAFQHTAARRRLDLEMGICMIEQMVSTHSRPKAAGRNDLPDGLYHVSFNTQPPEGGWDGYRQNPCPWADVSTHSRPKAAGIYSNRNPVT